MTDAGSTIKLTQSDLIFLHSPVNLLAQFVLLLEERFSQKRLPWEFSRDENETDVFIHTEYNFPQETANASPRIVVGRGTVVHRQMVIGDMGPDQPEILTKEGYYRWGMGECDIRIQCVSENRGEANIIGDIVQTLIGMSKYEICKQFTLHEVTDTMLQPVEPWERDKEKWQASVQFRVKFEQRWFTIPVAPQLREITMYSKSSLDALDYVKTFVLPDKDLP